MSDDKHTYTNPKYMPSIVVASPGNVHHGARLFCAGLDFLNYVYFEKSQVLCNPSYGYGLLQAKNATHLHWQWMKTGAPDPYEPHSSLRAERRHYDEEALTEMGRQRVEALSKEHLGASVSWEQWLTELGAGAEARVQKDTYPSLGDYLWIVQESHGPRDNCNV